ncbi:MAG: YbaK/EbsC family protein [Actinomycetota bacterium]|nr:YbaK/EbsC family protein [Actinomycetota bacterium]
MKSSVDVHNHLQELEIPHEFYKVSGPAASLEIAAEAAGVDPHEIARVEVLRADDNPVIVIVPGDREIDFEKLGKITNSSIIEKLHPDDILSLTGYHERVMPPVAHVTEMPVFIDYYTLKVDVLYTGSGENGSILKIRSYDLVRATNGEIADLVRND